MKRESKYQMSELSWKQLPKLFSYEFELIIMKCLPGEILIFRLHKEKSQVTEVISITIWPVKDTEFKIIKKKKTVLFESFETNLKLYTKAAEESEEDSYKLKGVECGDVHQTNFPISHSHWTPFFGCPFKKQSWGVRVCLCFFKHPEVQGTHLNKTNVKVLVTLSHNIRVWELYVCFTMFWQENMNLELNLRMTEALHPLCV